MVNRVLTSQKQDMRKDIHVELGRVGTKQYRRHW